MKKIYLGVREFALPVPRVGSIETHSGYGAVPLSGQDLHLLIQSQYAQKVPNYRSEFRLSRTFERGGYQFIVSGRVDGLFDGANPQLEEIKTAFNEVELTERLRHDPNHPYVLQLQSYMYFYHKQFGQIPEGHFLVVSTRNQKSLTLPIEYFETDYEAWLERRLDELVIETKAREQDAVRRLKLSEKLVFPFPTPRRGQIELIEKVQGALKDQKKILLQAPTGLGKTVGVLYPSLKDALSRGRQTVYVTPKNSQHSVAEEAIERFQEQGSKVKGLTLNAKSKMCFKEEVICNPQYCEYAKDYYQKVAEHKLVDKMAKKKTMTPKGFLKVGLEYEVCPFELSLDSLERADVVIGDYNYVFAPRNILSRLSPEPQVKKTRPNLVVDEAHNLPSRAQDYFSPELSSGVLKGLAGQISNLKSIFGEEALELIEKCVTTIESFKPSLGQTVIELRPSAFQELDQKLRDFLGRYLESDVVIEARDPIMSLVNYWSNFTQSVELTGDAFFTTYVDTYSGPVIKITCCDAGQMIALVYENFANTVAFSATLKPFDYYARLSGYLPSEILTEEFVSPFPKANRKVLVIPQISTKYSDRNANYGKVAKTIERIIALKKGNYFAFFPSFEFLDRVFELIHAPDFRTMRQSREMNSSDIKEILTELKSGFGPHLVFAVQGGVFSEGVDYPGDMVIGAFIVGPALPAYSSERKLMKEYYDKHYTTGYEYAYTYPAMTRVVQAAGRVIRSETDRGLIVLLDTRFIYETYFQSMPSDWFETSVQELVSTEILNDIKRFWSSDLSTSHTAMEISLETRP